MKSWTGAEAALRFSIQYRRNTRAGYLVFRDRLEHDLAFAIAGTWSRAMLCWRDWSWR
jgi:hypothetical protein